MRKNLFLFIIGISVSYFSIAKLHAFGLSDVGNAFNKATGGVVDQARTTFNNAINPAIDSMKKLPEALTGAGRQAAEAAATTLQNAASEAEKAWQQIRDAHVKALGDAGRNLLKSANDIVDAAEAGRRYMQREIAGYGQSIDNAKKRIEEGKLVDAVWHFSIDPLQNQDKNLGQLASENQLVAQAGAVAANFYGGPAGSAAYAAWLTYKQTGNADAAIRVGIASGIQNGFGGAASSLPSGTAGELAKKALVTAAIGGVAVAAAGGDQEAVQEAFLKQGGMVLVQAGQSYVTKKFDASTNQVEHYCTTAIGISCKPALNAVQRDSNGNIIYDERGFPKIDSTKLVPGREKLGTWGSEIVGVAATPNLPLPNLKAVSVLGKNWAISWDKNAFTSKNIRSPAVSLTYIGEGSPFDQKINELAAIAGLPTTRVPVPVLASPRAPEYWVALGDVGVKEDFFVRVMPSKGKPVIAVGEILMSTRPINVRPGPADWSSAEVMPQGSYLSVAEIRELRTKAGQTQRWARLDPSH